MIWAILAASSTGLLIALLGFRMPMLVAATLLGFPTLFFVGTMADMSFLTAAGQAFVGVFFLQICYLAGAAAVVLIGTSRAAPSGKAVAPGRRLLSFIPALSLKARMSNKSGRLKGE